MKDFEKFIIDIVKPTEIEIANILYKRIKTLEDDAFEQAIRINAHWSETEDKESEYSKLRSQTIEEIKHKQDEADKLKDQLNLLIKG